MCACAQTANLDCFTLSQSFFRQIHSDTRDQATTSFLCRLLFSEDDLKGLRKKE
jgi:hypothetical protein